MGLERESISWIDDDLFYLVERAILEDIVDSPRTIPYLEISSIREIFWEFGDFRIELFFISRIFYFLYEVTGAMSLRSEPIDDLDSLRSQENSFGDF